MVSVWGFRFRVLGFGFWVRGFGFRVWVSGFWFLVSGSGFRISGFGFRDYKRGTPVELAISHLGVAAAFDPNALLPLDELRREYS